MVNKLVKLHLKKFPNCCKKITGKYKKMRYKKPPAPFTFRDIADAESVVYDNNTRMEDVNSNRGVLIIANKIKNKYKKMRAKNRSLPFDLD